MNLNYHSNVWPVKQIIDVSRKRNCWKDEELKDIEITYHNVCEIYKQLQEKEPNKLEEITGKED